MTISGNVPQHLVVGARTGFLAALKTTPQPWQRVAGTFNMGAKSIDLVDLGTAPMPVEGNMVIQSFIEKSLTVKPRDWNITVGLSYNATKDDQTGNLDTKVRSAGENFQRAMNAIVFKALDAGDAATYGLCYDGNEFFDGAHIDKGADYQTGQDNVDALALSLDNFTTELVKARAFVDDRGDFTDFPYDLIVTSPTLEYTAAQITGNVQAYDTASREANPYAGKFSYIISPYMSSTAWVLLASGVTQKPLYLAMREQPNLQDAWFDPAGADGGMYYFKFYARYNVFYGDWRLAIMGNS
jgi:phage major head subunit gpT-like protein